MKRTLILILQVVLLGLAALWLGGRVWGSLWLYHDWPGPPGLLARWIGTDGEQTYDAITDEMSIICFVVLLAVWMAIRVALRKRKKQ